MKRIRFFITVLFSAMSLSATAGVIQTMGAGTAVSSADGIATFDILGTAGQPATLLNYTEDGVVVSVNDTHGGSNGVYYGISGNTSFVTISAAGGLDIFGVEAVIYSGHAGGGVLVWQALNNGSETGAGTVPNIEGYNNVTDEVFGWHDTQGFDELRLAVVFSGPPQFGSSQAIALDNVKIQTNMSVPAPASILLVLMGLFGFFRKNHILRHRQ